MIEADTQDQAPSGPILGVDFGERRIGVACSDALGMLAHPLDMVAVAGSDFAGAARRVAEMAEARGAARVVVGLPRHMRSGEEGDTARAARMFGERLAELGLRVTMWDERLTSRLAERSLDERLGHGKKRRAATRAGRVDVVAACLVLQSYLDACAAAGSRPTDDNDDRAP